MMYREINIEQTFNKFIRYFTKLELYISDIFYSTSGVSCIGKSVKPNKQKQATKTQNKLLSVDFVHFFLDIFNFQELILTMLIQIISFFFYICK